MIAVEDGRYTEAIPMLQHVLDDSPLITAAQMQLGIALARVRRYPEAIAALRKAVQLMPDSTQAQYELGLALFETGAWQESVPYFEFVAKKRPKWADAQYSLASVYARIKRVPGGGRIAATGDPARPRTLPRQPAAGADFQLAASVRRRLALPEAGGCFPSPAILKRTPFWPTPTSNKGILRPPPANAVAPRR